MARAAICATSAVTAAVVLLVAGSSGREPRAAGPLWRADHEEGTLSDWTRGSAGYDRCWAENGGTCAVASRAHSGRWAAALRADTTRGRSGARLPKTQAGRSGPPLPPDAYYSSWFLIPGRVRVAVWWNVMQWKVHGRAPGSDPAYVVNVTTRRDGRMVLRLYDHVGDDGRYGGRGAGWVARSRREVPAGRWWHLECRYVWSVRRRGRVTCWQDGRRIWDVRGVHTRYRYGRPADGRPLQWTLGNYSAGTTPGDQTLYVDDAAIATARLGP